VNKTMKYPQCQWCISHVASINLWGNAFLAVLKATAGILGNSQALIADAVHSLSDVFIAVFLCISLKISGRSPDKTYPYGYGHIEFIAAGIISLTLICTGILICYTSISSVISGVCGEPEMIAVMALIVSIGGNELLFRHSMCVGKQANSPAIVANAWDNRADALSSLAAFFGVAGAKLGYPVLDPIAAIVVGGMIMYSAVKTLSGAIKGMMDTSVEPEEMEKIHSAAAKVDGIKEITSLVARKSGQKILIDMEVGVDSRIDLKKAKNMAEEIKGAISRNVDNIGNATVRLGPCRT